MKLCIRIGSLLVAGLTCLPALAQDGGTPPPPPPQGQGEDGQGQGRRQRGQRGMGGLGIPVEQMRETLGLSTEQVAQLEALNAELRAKGEELRGLFQSGDFETARAKMQELRGELEKRRDEILTPEQVKKFQEEMQNFGRGMGRGGFGGEGGGRGGRGGRGGPGGRQSKERLREEAVKALALTSEEQAVVMPLLDAVLDTRELLQREGDERRDGFMKKVRETTDQQQLATLLADLRKSRDADTETLKQATSQLREVLTVEQECKLVGLNILD